MNSDVGESDQLPQPHVSEEEEVAPDVAAAVLEPTTVEAAQPALVLLARCLMLGEDHTGPEDDLPPLVLRVPRGVASSVPLKPRALFRPLERSTWPMLGVMAPKPQRVTPFNLLLRRIGLAPALAHESAGLLDQLSGR